MAKFVSFIFRQFDKRNGSTRLSVVHDALQIVNIADLVRKIHVRNDRKILHIFF